MSSLKRALVREDQRKDSNQLTLISRLSLLNVCATRFIEPIISITKF